MTDNQLSGKELYEQQKREREAAKSSTTPSSQPKGGGKVWPWIVTILVLAGIILGVYKLATSTPPGGTPQGDGVLSLPVNSLDHTLGDPAAPVQLVEYGDFQCPSCAFYAPWIKRLAEESGSDLSITFRHFPLRQIHPNAQVVSQIVEAAGKQGKLWEAIEIVFANQDTWAKQLSPRDTIYTLLAPLALDMTKLKADVDSQAVEDKIESDLQSGIASGVSGTPSFFINGQQIQNPRSYPDFRQLIIDAAGSSATNATNSSN